MKKAILILLSFTLVISFLLVPSSTTQASIWPNPVVTPLSGDTEFIVKLLDPIRLNFGLAKTGSGLVVPAGFPLGEKQFGGKAVTIKGLEGEKASLCFSFPTYRYGWDGNIYQWKESAWSLFPSTLTEGKEGSAALVCTTIDTDGTYALIISFNSTQVKSSLPECGEDFSIIPILDVVDNDDDTIETAAVIGAILNAPYPVGTNISYSVFNISPHGILTGALHQTGKVYPFDGIPDDFSMVYFLKEEDIPEAGGIFIPPEYILVTFHYIDGWVNASYTVRITTPTCYKDFSSEELRSGV